MIPSGLVRSFVVTGIFQQETTRWEIMGCASRIYASRKNALHEAFSAAIEVAEETQRLWEGVHCGYVCSIYHPRPFLSFSQW